MKKNTFNRALSLVFAAALLAGCAGTETQDTGAEEAAAAERAAAERAAAERAAAESAERQRQQQEMMQVDTTVYFDFDEATLRPDAKTTLDRHIENLRNTNQNVRLEGHADERGTREYNMALGERRANAVANYLVINGIPRYRIETVSYGEERPVAMGHDEQAWSENRRVEIETQ